MRNFVKIAKVAQVLIYIVVCLLIVFIGTYQVALVLLISLGYTLIELDILRTKSHKVTSLCNFGARLFIILLDIGCLTALSIYRSEDEDRKPRFAYPTCIALLATSPLLSIVISLIYDCCPGNALLQDQD